MTILTRPELTELSGVTLPDGADPPVMSVPLSNSLLTAAPMSRAELECCRAHYRTLLDMLTVSGPIFSGQRRVAIDMHNKAVRRLNGIREDERRRAMEDEDVILEIER